MVIILMIRVDLPKGIPCSTLGLQPAGLAESQFWAKGSKVPFFSKSLHFKSKAITSCGNNSCSKFLKILEGNYLLQLNDPGAF